VLEIVLIISLLAAVVVEVTAVITAVVAVPENIPQEHRRSYLELRTQLQLAVVGQAVQMVTIQF
jgi:hypothetical protein